MYIVFLLHNQEDSKNINKIKMSLLDGVKLQKIIQVTNKTGLEKSTRLRTHCWVWWVPYIFSLNNNNIKLQYYTVTMKEIDTANLRAQWENFFFDQMVSITTKVGEYLVYIISLIRFEKDHFHQFFREKIGKYTRFL